MKKLNLWKNLKKKIESVSKCFENYNYIELDTLKRNILNFYNNTLTINEIEIIKEINKLDLQTKINLFLNIMEKKDFKDENEKKKYLELEKKGIIKMEKKKLKK
jgi:hypothetical protein